MGMELSGRWPEIFRCQDAENLYLASQFQPDFSGTAHPLRR